MDVMITHGGNNTITECLHHSVRVLVLPRFSDQLCNAARIQENGLGLALKAFACSKQEFHQAVKRLVEDEKMGKRVQSAANDIQQDTGLDQVFSHSCLKLM